MLLKYDSNQLSLTPGLGQGEPSSSATCLPLTGETKQLAQTSKFLGRWDESQPACSFTVDLTHAVSLVIQYHAWICISKLKDCTVKCKRGTLKKSLQKSFKELELFFLPLTSLDFPPRPMKLEKTAYVFCMLNIFLSPPKHLYHTRREMCFYKHLSSQQEVRW